VCGHPIKGAGHSGIAAHLLGFKYLFSRGDDTCSTFGQVVLNHGGEFAADWLRTGSHFAGIGRGRIILRELIIQRELFACHLEASVRSPLAASAL
jgi:hypothetical protein